MIPNEEIRLESPPETPDRFRVNIAGARPEAGVRLFHVVGADPEAAADHRLRDRSHNAYLDASHELALRFGTRVPRNRQPVQPTSFTAPYQPLITRNLAAGIRCGYGDPAVSRVTDAAGDPWYYLLSTSNDEPGAFPILRSRDLREWAPVGFVFPQGTKPRWAADGEGVGDFWAPEMHFVGGEYRVYFAAREWGTRELSIGVAAAASPEGPFTTPGEPLLRGDVIDPHVVVGDDGAAYLFWKDDTTADGPLGPYRKLPEPLLRSTEEWWGPGHPSVAEGPDGEPWMFLHAFFPGKTGYNEFRALLAVPLVLDGERVAVRETGDAP